MNDAVDLVVYWSKNPPTHIAVAAVLGSLGGGSKGTAETATARKPTIEELKRGL